MLINIFSVCEVNESLKADSESLKSIFSWYIEKGILPDYTVERTYLYYKGNEYEDLTGGYNIIKNGTLNKYATYMEYKSSSSSRNGMVTNNKITFPNWASTLYIEFTYLYIKNSASNGIVYATIDDDNTASSDLKNEFSVELDCTGLELSNYTIKIDIASVNEVPYYLIPIICGSANSAYSITAKISAIWYE